MIPLASMGDIAFLLIIFFMLTSNFIKEAHIKVTPPASPDIEVLKESRVSLSMDEEGNVWLQGQPCPQALIESATETLLENQEDKVVVLKIDKGLTQEQFGPVLMALSKAGAEIALVGTKETGRRK
jgi:biopolymer transport protein ExbD